jgi:hypothetical protein
MKIQNILRMQAIVIGFGAALLLASSAPAQEIENTRFDDGPIVAEFPQPSPAPVAKAPNSAVAKSNVVRSCEASLTPTATQEASLSLRTSTENWMISALFVCIAWIALYALSEAKRANRNLEARSDSQVNRRPALS